MSGPEIQVHPDAHAAARAGAEAFAEQAREWKPTENDLQRGLNPSEIYARVHSRAPAWRFVAMSAVQSE